MKKLKKHFTSDQDISAVQDNVADYLNQLDRLPQLDSHIIADITLNSAVDNAVAHELGRNIEGWQIIRKNANAVIWESPTVNESPTKLVLLRASAACKVTILFF
jgi:hypothetical protein